MENKRILFGLTMAWMCVTWIVASAASIYVAPEGDDNASGTILEPLATFAGARDVVRSILTSDPCQDIDVIFRGGTYQLAGTVALGTQDSAESGYKITYRAYGDEKPVFTSGVAVTGWTQISSGNEPSGTPVAAQGHLWRASIPTGISRFKTMFDGDTELPRARCDGFVPTIQYTDGRASCDELYYPASGTIMKNWSNMQDIEILIRAQFPWVFDILTLQSVDTVNHIATMTRESHTTLVAPRTQYSGWHDQTDETAWVENAIEALDTAGEWVVNTDSDYIYYWPSGGTPSDDIVIPKLTVLVQVEGASGTPVEGIGFQGLTFKHGERHTFASDVDSRMRPTLAALLRLLYTKDCLVRNCVFENSGGAGIRMDEYTQQNTVTGCNFENLGAEGIACFGDYDGVEADTYSTGNVLTDNIFYRTGLHHWRASAIEMMHSSSNVIANNTISDCGYNGISVWGAVDGGNPGLCNGSQGNEISYNDVTGFCKRLGDGAGINLRWCEGSNTIWQNYVHDFLEPGVSAAIRCDDTQAGVEIEENLIYYGVSSGICIKEENDIINNMILDILDVNNPANPTSKSDRASVMLSPNTNYSSSCEDSMIQRNIFYHSQSGQSVEFYQDYESELGLCAANDNLYRWTANITWTQGRLDSYQTLGVDADSINANPLFVDYANGDFHLQANSPAITQLGFQQLDMDNFGWLHLEPTAWLDESFADADAFEARWFYEDENGSWSVSGGELVQSSTATRTCVVANAAAQRNCSYCVRMKTTTPGNDTYDVASMRFRYVDAYNYMEVFLKTNGTLIVKSWEDGVATTHYVATIGLDPTDWHTFVAQSTGDVHEIIVDGTSYATFVNDDHAQGGLAVSSLQSVARWQYAMIIPCSDWREDFSVAADFTNQWETSGGTWSVSGGSLQQTSGSGWPRAVPYTVDSSDCIYSARFKTTAVNNTHSWYVAKMLFRYIDSNDYMQAFVSRIGNLVVVSNKDGTTTTLMNESTALSCYDLHTFEIKSMGGAHEIVVDDVSYGTVVSSDNSHGALALATAQNTGQWDHAEIQPYIDWRDDLDDADVFSNSWVTSGGTWSISSGELLQSNGGGYAHALCGSLEAADNVCYTARFATTSVNGTHNWYVARMRFRYVDADNYMEVFLSQAGYLVVLSVKDGVQTTLLNQYTVLSTYDLHTFDIECSGSDYDIYIDSTKYATVTCSDHSFGKVGVATARNTGRWLYVETAELP